MTMRPGCDAATQAPDLHTMLLCDKPKGHRGRHRAVESYQHTPGQPEVTYRWSTYKERED